MRDFLSAAAIAIPIIGAVALGIYSLETIAGKRIDHIVQEHASPSPPVEFKSQRFFTAQIVRRKCFNPGKRSAFVKADELVRNAVINRDVDREMFIWVYERNSVIGWIMDLDCAIAIIYERDA